MISFIIPIYNSEAYLRACIESVLHQGTPEVEVILVDDGSADGSLAIAKAYAEKDKRVKVLEQAHAGQSVARNNGLEHAQGEYIAFVDADDTIASDWSERHLAAIEGVDYVQSGYKRVQDSGFRSQKSEVRNQKSPRFAYQFTSPCMRLYRRQAIEGLQFEEGMIYEDVLWSVDLWLRGARCRRIDYTGYHYTVNPNSTTSRPHPEAQRKVMDELRKRLTAAPWSKKTIVLYTMIRLQFHFWKS